VAKEQSNKKKPNQKLRPHRPLNPALSTRWRGSCHGANISMDSCVFISILQNRCEQFLHTSQTQKKLSRRCIWRSYGESNCSFSCNKPKKNFIVERLNHYANGTLICMMFAILYFRTVIHRNFLAYYIVGWMNEIGSNICDTYTSLVFWLKLSRKHSKYAIV
jgi:hypothetical protein